MKPIVNAELSLATTRGIEPYLPWIVTFTASLFFLFEFLQVNIFNAITPSLMREFPLSAGKVGQISAYYFYATMLFVFPAGIILDRFSTRKVILFAMGSSILCTFVFSAAKSIQIAEICRFITGIGGSFCLISCIRLAAIWFVPKRLAFVIGLIVTMAMVGGMIAQTPMTILTDLYGWRNMLMIDGATGIVMLSLIYLLVQDKPQNPNHVDFHQASSWSGLKNSLKNSLGNLQNWLGGIYTSLLNLPLMLMGAIWGSLYLVQAHHLTRTQASLVISMLFIGTIIGSPFIGWYSDRIGRRKLPMLLCCLFALIDIFVIMFLPNLTTFHLLVLFFGLGFFTSGQILSYPLIAESNPRNLTASAEGIASSLIMAGGITQPIFGILLGIHWKHTSLDGVPYYSHQDFLTAMLIIPVAFVLGLIAVFFVKETYCKSVE